MTRSRPLYGLDIETDTRVDGLDPAVAPIVAVAVATDEGTRVLDGEEPQLLIELDALLARLRPGIIVTWNGGRFDLPFISRRAAHWSIPLGLRLEPDPHDAGRAGDGDEREPGWVGEWGPHHHLDGYRLYRADVGRALPVSCGLKPMARFVGLVPVEVDRDMMHILTPDEMADYVSSDAILARDLVARRGVAIESHIDRLPSRPPGPVPFV